MLLRQLKRFAITGGAATIAHVVAGLALHHFAGLSPLWANFFAFLTAWIVSYLGNWFWTFEARTTHRYSAPRFLIVALGSFALNQAIVWFTTGILDWPFWLALVPVVIIVPLAGFLASRYWAYNDRRSSDQASAS